MHVEILGNCLRRKLVDNMDHVNQIFVIKAVCA